MLFKLFRWIAEKLLAIIWTKYDHCIDQVYYFIDSARKEENHIETCKAYCVYIPQGNDFTIVQFKTQPCTECYWTGNKGSSAKRRVSLIIYVLSLQFLPSSSPKGSQVAGVGKDLCNFKLISNSSLGHILNEVACANGDPASLFSLCIPLLKLTV